MHRVKFEDLEMVNNMHFTLNNQDFLPKFISAPRRSYTLIIFADENLYKHGERNGSSLNWRLKTKLCHLYDKELLIYIKLEF